MLARSLAGIAAMLALSTVSPPSLVAQAGNPSVTDTQGVTYEDILQGLEDPSRWLTFSGDYSGQRHSPLPPVCSSARAMPISWRSTGRPGGASGRSSSRTTALGMPRRWPLLSSTGRSSSGSLVVSIRRGDSSTPTIQRPENGSGGSTPFRGLASREVKPGRRTLKTSHGEAGAHG